jgi:serine/threonine protein kinase
MLIADRFRLEQKIGDGTFADIWRALDTAADGDGRPVVLKIFRPAAAGNPDSPWEPVFREVAAGLRLPPHPNVMTAWALLHTDFFAGVQTPCLVMEYVDGCNLALWLERLEAPGPETIAQRLAVMSDLLSALAHAHASGVIHRDLSFGNVLVRRSHPPRALLSDFGCAQIDEQTADAVDEAESPDVVQPINPPPYATLLSRGAGARRDVYAFATLCYLTLTGRHPLTDDWQSMRTGQWNGVPHPHQTLARRPMTELAPWIAADPRLVALSRVLLQCVAQDPDARPSSGTALQSLWSDIMA